MGLSIFFSLNLYFLANFELVTNSVTLLFNDASTITPFCISILLSPIFTVTFLSISPLSRLQQNLNPIVYYSTEHCKSIVVIRA